jgi:uncharacterized protein YgiM (DUF1202 family)
VRVTASTLNVRRQPTTTADVLTQVKRGDRLTLVTVGNDWMQVLLPNGDRGWVSAQHVETADTPARKSASKTQRRSGCLPDSDYRFDKTPTPSFSDSGAHGLSTKVLSNTTGDESLAFLAARELKGAKFVAPVRNCVARAFIFTYTRTF